MKTNNLIYKTNKIHKGKHLFVTIRLNDECKNGHQDFAITANIYEAGKTLSDRNMISGGCCHDEILKAYPEFKIFVELHICDYLGNPMHATANGLYHLKNGLGNTPITSDNFVNEFCEYYRISKKDFDILKLAESEAHYYILLCDLGIPAKWKLQADEAINKLEELTGNEFVIDSVRTQLIVPSDEKIAEETDKLMNGYYSAESKAKREHEKGLKVIADLEAEAQKNIDSINLELDVRKQLFAIGGHRVLDNVIFYTHSKELGFNWRSYGERIEAEEAKQIVDSLKLDFEIKYKIAN